MSKFAFAALEELGGYNIEPRGEMLIKVSSFVYNITSSLLHVIV